MNRLLVIDFIMEHLDNWEDILKGEPYFLEIKWKDNYVLLKYNQISSDFSNPIVKECRGLILKKVLSSWVNLQMTGISYEPVAVPFYKFFNAEEPNANSDLQKIIDNSKYGLFVTEKVDGALIKVWYDSGKWHVSTSGNIDASDARLQADTTDLQEHIISLGLKSYYDLFLVAKENSNLNYDVLDKAKTYIFELVSPYNRIVVRYQDTKLIHIGTRNNFTMKEEETDILVEKPPKFMTNDISEIIEYAKKLQIKDNANYEGFVVYDKEYNRVKIKSPKYLELHYLKSNGLYPVRKILEILIKNEQEELLAYFPEFKGDFGKVEALYKAYIERTWGELASVDMSLDRKSYAEIAKGFTNSHIAFKAHSLHERGIELTKDWVVDEINKIRVEYLEVMIGGK